MNYRINFQEHREQHKLHRQRFIRLQRLIFAIFFGITFMSIGYFIVSGIIVYKLIDNPEMIGEWFNRLLTGLGMEL